MKKHIMVLDSFDDVPRLLHAIRPSWEKARLLVKGESQEIVYVDTPYSRIVSANNWQTGRKAWDAKRLSAFIDATGGQYSYHTPSAFAMSLYRSMTPPRFWMPLDGYKAKISRDSLYGGRCEVLEFGEFQVQQYDINSSYPYAAMQLRFPDPRQMVYADKYSVDNILKFEGVSRVTFSQTGYLPVLPMRVNGRIYYAKCDHATGVYTHTELRYALQRGVMLHGIDRQYIAPATLDPFTEYMHYCFKKRLETDDKVWKMIANSLIGRMSTVNHGMMSFRVLGQSADAKGIPADRLMKRGIWFVGEPIKPRLDTNPLWASMVLAGARSRIHDTALSQRAVYLDTDCVFSVEPERGKYLPVSDTIGDFKVSTGVYTIKGAKLYKAEETGADTMPGLVRLKMKGIAIAHRTIKDFDRSRFTNERFRFPDGSTRAYEYEQGVLL